MLSNKSGIEDISAELKGKRVLIRVDFNVPINDGVVTDSTRISATLPTIQYAFDKGARCVVLMSHCGRPDGRKQEKYTLNPVVPVLEKLIGRPVTFLNDCVGPTIEAHCASPKEGELILLENLRFHVEEEGKGVDEAGNKTKASEEDTKKFRESLTKMGDIFVNDAFGTAHRGHSSMVGVQHSSRVAGLLMKKELEYFAKALETPRPPFLAILGGAKVKDKIQLITNLLDRVNLMIIGGGMAYTFKKVMTGMSIGSSLYDEEGAKIVPKIIEQSKEKNVEIVLPVDFVCGDSFSNDAKRQTYSEEEGIPDKWMGMDSGPKSISNAKEVIAKASTIIWNGPQGVFEMPNFASGSLAFLDAVCEATQKGAISIVGGGDTASLVEHAGKTSSISHVSTGGGASLELLEGKELPGVVALSGK